MLKSHGFFAARAAGSRNIDLFIARGARTDKPARTVLIEVKTTRNPAVFYHNDRTKEQWDALVGQAIDYNLEAHFFVKYTTGDRLGRWRAFNVRHTPIGPLRRKEGLDMTQFLDWKPLKVGGSE